MKTLQELYNLWDQLSDIPVSECGDIEKSFFEFEPGTSQEVVWHWFETQNSDFLVGEVQSGIRRKEQVSVERG